MANGDYYPAGQDFEFVRWMNASWQCVRGEEQHPVQHCGHIAVYQQPNSFKCGHCCIRNVLVYLKYWPKNPNKREVSLFGDFYSPVAHKDILIQTMSLFSREMDPEQRDERFSAPFVPVVGPSLPDDICPLFIDDKVHKPTQKKHLTRQHSKVISYQVSYTGGFV